MRRYYAELAEVELARHTPGPHEDPQGMLYLIARYLEYLRVRHYSPQTVYTRSKMLRPFRLFCEQAGLTQARQVTRAVIFNYQGYLFHYRKRDGHPLALETQNHWLSVVASFFGWLTRQSHILYNPASDLEYSRTPQRLPRAILSAAEVAAVFNVPDVATPLGLRNRAILEVLYSTGMRRAELCALDKNDLDFERGLVFIDQGKGHKDRLIPIGERALKWIEKYLAEARPLLGSSVAETAVFLNTKGERVNPNRLGSQVRDLLRRAGITKRGSCHLFRHTMATQLLEAGCDIRFIQEMLGHSNLESTKVYTQVAVGQLKAVHQKYHPANKTGPGAHDGLEAITPGNGHQDAPQATQSTPAATAGTQPHPEAKAALLAMLDAEAQAEEAE
jgi:integrase/recombinase XerD